MTQEEEDLIRGRVGRESKTADEKLRLVLAKAEGIRDRLSKLVLEIDNRVQRARVVDAKRPTVEGAPRMPPYVAGATAARGIDQLDSYADVLDLDALRTLNEEICEAVVHAAKLRERKRELEL